VRERANIVDLASVVTSLTRPGGNATGGVERGVNDRVVEERHCKQAMCSTGHEQVAKKIANASGRALRGAPGSEVLAWQSQRSESRAALNL
jgi:hypothetical protein